MKGINLDRRDFVKIIGASALTLVAAPALSACTDRKTKIKTLNIEELSKYQLATYQKDINTEVIYVRFTNDFPYYHKKYYGLELNDNVLNEYLLFQRKNDNNYDDELSFEDNFKNYFGIASLEPAIDAVQSVAGIKGEYTVEDLKQTLEEVLKDLKQTNNKVLTK